MKTFETKNLIKNRKMFGSKGNDRSRGRHESRIVDEHRYSAPTFKNEQEFINGKNELFEARISKSLTKTKGIIFSDGFHEVKMIPFSTENAVAILGEDGKLMFQAFNGQDDLRYSLKDNGLKEEIIIHEKRDEYSFKFKVKLSNLSARMIDDEKIIFVDAETGEEIFKMADLVMNDAIGEESRSITLALEQDTLTMTCNSLWINDEDRVLPITIDPQIEVITKSYATLSCINQSGSTVSAINGKFSVGRTLSTQKNYLQFVINGQKLYQVADSQNGKYTLSFSHVRGEIPSVNAKRFKVSVNGTVYQSGLKFDQEGRYSIDISTHVLAQTTATIKIELDETTGSTVEYFYAYDYSHADEALRPSVRYETLDVGEAIKTASLDKQLTQADGISVNLHDGTYLYTYRGPLVKDKSLKIGVDFTHSSLKRSNAEIKDAHIGGLKTNLHQYLIKSSNANTLLGTKKALYIDGDNRSHELFERWFYETETGLKTFVNKSQVYLDNDGKLKTKVGSEVFEVKYDVVSDDGLLLISAASFSNYTKKTSKKIASRIFRIQLNGSTQIVVEISPSTIRMPHYTADSINGTQLTTTATKPDWHTKPTDSFEAAELSSKETWFRWTYVNPISVNSGQAGTSTSILAYRTHYYDLPLLKDETGFYVEIYSKKELAKYYQAGSHAIMHKASTPTKVYLMEEVIYDYDQTSDVYQSEDLIAATDKVKQINKYLDELYATRKELEKSAKAIDSQINLVNKESTRFQIQIALNNKASSGEAVTAANYGNETQAVSRAESLISIHERRVSLLKQLGDLHSKIDEYEIMLENTLAEQNHLLEIQKDAVSDLVIDENGNALGFDYHGKLIMIQDQHENKLEIIYDEEKLVSVKGEKEKIEFTYSEQTGLLEYVNDTKGRKIFFKYDSNNKIKSISKEQKADSKKIVSLTFDGELNLSQINHLSGYMTDIQYQTNKVINIKQKSYLDHVIDNEIVLFEISNSVFPVIFNNTIQYTSNKTIVTEARNNQSVTYAFDQIGRVVNEETTDTTVVNNYVEDMQILEANFDKHSQNDLSFSGSLGGLETLISLSLGTLSTNGTRINKSDSVNGMYTFLVDVIDPSSVMRQITLGAQVYKGAEEVSKTKFAVRYDNPRKQILALPIYIPNDSDSTQVQISIKSNVALSLSWLMNPRFAKGEWTLNEFDSQERLIKQTSGAETIEQFDFVGRHATRVIATNIHGEKRTSFFEYDSENRLVYAKDDLGSIEETYYNERGQIIEKRSYQEDASSEVNKITYKYDEHGAFIKDEQSQLVGNSELVAQHKDDNEGITNFGFDFHTEELTSKTFIGQGVSNRTRYTYTNNLLTGLAHNGFKVKYKLDYLGRKLETTIADEANPIVKHVYEDNFAYDVNNPTYIGRRVTQIFKDNSANKFTYNKLGLLHRIDFYQDLSGQLTTATEFAYDSYNRKVSKRVNGTIIETYAYHVNGEVSTRTFNGGGETYAFDSHQRVTTISNTLFSHPVNLEYDAQNKLKKASSDAISVATAYDPLNRVNKAVVAKGANEVIADTFEFLTRKNGPTQLVKEHTKYINGFREDALVYSYDKAGNITKIVSDESNTRYAYDELNRLIREDNEILGKTYLYRYDAGGNITSRREYSYTTDDKPEICQGKNIFQYSLTGHKDRLMKTTIDDETLDVAYDTMGRPLSYKGYSLVWNKRGTLASYGTTTFGYNSDGIRTSKGSITFKVDGTRILEQISGSNTLKPIYLVDKMIGFWYNGSRYLFSKNIQGDVVSVHIDTGALVAKYVYDAWGNHKVLNSSGVEDTNPSSIGNINPFRYRGYYYDVETKLYYLNSRYYDPEIGRFISPDILSILDETMMDENGLNLYMYCGNNPIMRVDANGMAWWNPFSWNWNVAGQIAAAVGIVIGLAALTIAAAFIGGPVLVGAAIGAWIGTAAGGIYGGVKYGTEGIIPGMLGGFIAGAAIGAATGVVYGLVTGQPLIGSTGRVFWSGVGGPQNAASVAKMLGGKTLEMTKGGQFLTWITGGSQGKIATLLWKGASALYAFGAVGQTYMLYGDSMRIESVWATIEYPIIYALEKAEIIWQYIWELITK